MTIFDPCADGALCVSVPESGCWIWIGNWDNKGYGRFGNRKAHRLAMQALDGAFVCHKCDTPACVNPAHLFIGSAADNNADRSQKGRNSRRDGERNTRCKLSDAQVTQIRSAYKAGGVTQRELGRIYGVSNQQISSIVSLKVRTNRA